ncbi:MAG TPA: hypothetical protein VNU68_02000 [Verrucomicrobiae bacterium]|nr:hypothetical protein [Verrucomicrobiae bacterium]
MSTTNNHTATQALLVSLNFTLCRQSKQSKVEAKRSEDANNAHRGVCKSSYFYFQEEVGAVTNDALAELKSYMNAWRTAHNRLTRVWDSNNTRLLPATLVQAYLEMDSKWKEGFPAKLAEFFEVYPDWQITAPHRMGALYEASNFPSLEECRNDISYEVTMIPLPEAEQWKRISIISPDLAHTMEESTNSKIAKAVEEARKQTWVDLFTPVEKIVSTLSKDKPKIYDSLIGNLTDILNLAPAFNLSGDQGMNQFIAETKATLATINPDDLRNDPMVRASTCKKAEELLKKFGELGNRKFA